MLLQMRVNWLLGCFFCLESEWLRVLLVFFLPPHEAWSRLDSEIVVFGRPFLLVSFVLVVLLDVHWSVEWSP